MTGNSYINKILFGHSNASVDAKYIEGLMPFMFTTDFVAPSLPISPPIPTPSPPLSQQKQDLSTPKPRFQLNKNSLFWAIYEVENPKDAFLGTKANAEITHRINVIDTLKKTPKCLKDTNSKLTIEQTQALFGAMLTAKEDRLDFCIAYAAYYHKSIIVVYENTYTVFSPTVEVDLSDEENAIVLYASKPEHCNYVVYRSEKNLSREVITRIVESKVAGPLKSMSNYKTAELDDLANKLRIGTTQLVVDGDRRKEKRRTKEDIYNDIKVAIHKDSYGK